MNYPTRLALAIDHLRHSIRAISASFTARLINIVFMLDCFLFSLLTLGKAYPFESFSSAAYRAELNGRFYGRMRPVIDRGFHRWQKDHCKLAYERAALNLPPDQRNPAP